MFLITMCTLHRRKFPDLHKVKAAFETYAARASAFNVAVGRYVLMPDHIHFFVCGNEDFRLGEWVKGLKRAISANLRESGQFHLWQPGFFDHLLRSDESYGEKWQYVRDNPIRAGLALKAEDWLFQGEICQLHYT